MNKHLTKEQTYDRCLMDENLIPKNEIDKEQITYLLQTANEDSKALIALSKTKKDNWNEVYKLAYDVLHTLSEALLLSDKLKSLNPQCLFSALCVKHPELELNWEFFEKIRMKRDKIIEQSTSISQQDYKEIELQFTLYRTVLINSITKA